MPTTATRRRAAAPRPAPVTPPADNTPEVPANHVNGNGTNTGRAVPDVDAAQLDGLGYDEAFLKKIGLTADALVKIQQDAKTASPTANKRGRASIIDNQPSAQRVLRSFPAQLDRYVKVIDAIPEGQDMPAFEGESLVFFGQHNEATALGNALSKWAATASKNTDLVVKTSMSTHPDSPNKRTAETPTTAIVYVVCSLSITFPDEATPADNTAS